MLHRLDQVCGNISAWLRWDSLSGPIKEATFYYITNCVTFLICKFSYNKSLFKNNKSWIFGFTIHRAFIWSKFYTKNLAVYQVRPLLCSLLLLQGKVINKRPMQPKHVIHLKMAISNHGSWLKNRFFWLFSQILQKFFKFWCSLGPE